MKIVSKFLQMVNKTLDSTLSFFSLERSFLETASQTSHAQVSFHLFVFSIKTFPFFWLWGKGSSGETNFIVGVFQLIMIIPFLTAD